jgi:ABC-2 type transport system permease protein
MPWVMNMEVKNIAVDVVDSDRSTASQRIMHSIEASDYFIFNGQKASYGDAMKDIESNKADIIVEIPHNYEKDIVNGGHPEILISANAVNGTKGGIGSGYMAQTVSSNANGTQTVSADELFPTLNLYNKTLNYKVFMIPALMGILIMMLCGFLPALNIVGEKEAGTIEQINVTPVSKGTFILAKLIPYWIIGLVVMTICFVLAWAVYGITSSGNLLLVYILAMLLALVFSSIGLIISNYSDNMQQAMFVMWFAVVCMMLLSGLFTPVRSMPQWAQYITYVNPMRYFIDAVRTVFVRGGDFINTIAQFCVLVFFALIMGSWAIISYRKNS